MGNSVAKLFQIPKTILTTRDLALIWEETNHDNLKAKIAYHIKRGALIRLTRGVFTKDKHYDLKELATSLYTPSYISFQTVLRKAGIIFQHYDTIFAAGPWSRNIIIGETRITFRKLKDTVLFSPAGIENKESYSIASPERAFLDTIYLAPNYYFDNLRQINWEKCFELVKIYNNKQLIKRLKKYQKEYAQ
jgi:predicted transcriptional regulator of viral defense system